VGGSADEMRSSQEQLKRDTSNFDFIIIAWQYFYCTVKELVHEELKNSIAHFCHLGLHYTSVNSTAGPINDLQI